MSRGRLVPPNLDDRSWEEIVAGARDLIPKFAPEWTDHNPSDPGMALIELFAWIVEGMTYRLNRVPERNFIEFLNLIGITRDPATPASVPLTYTASGPAPVKVPRGSRASTLQVDENPAIVFETDEDAEILPINLTAAITISKQPYVNITKQISTAPLTGLTLDIPPSELQSLAFGFDAATTESIKLRVRCSKPAPAGSTDVNFWYFQPGPNTALLPAANIADTSDKFQQNGIISITVPNDWTAVHLENDISASPATPADAIDQPLFWIGMLIGNLSTDPLQLGIEHVLFNSVPATNALTVTVPELLGVSNGEPFQRFSLRNRPLFKAPDPATYDHLNIEVREPSMGGGFGPWQTWEHRDDFPGGPGQYFRLNPVTGEIGFGNHDAAVSPTGHASVPALGAEIRAAQYRHVAGGAEGNLPPETITISQTPIPTIVGVTNHAAAKGGSNEEAIEDTKRRGPEVLKNRYRAVTSEDYEYLAAEASTDIKKVRCLPPRLFNSYDTLPPGVSVGDPWTYGGLNRDVGNVHVIIIPDAPDSVLAPQPSAELIKETSDYLERRRTVTAMLQVASPRYLPIRVHLNINIWQKAVDIGLVPDPALSSEFHDQLAAKITKFLHPVHGGSDQQGWEIGQDVTIAALFEHIQPSPDIGFITDLKLEAMAPLYTPAARPFPINVQSVWIQMVDYEMVCSHVAHSITIPPPI